ncbi:MAG: hypothetical protein Q8S10_01075 [Thiobacillus sp.]|jgi:hypothetical protein|nr:hypothetical protein [Thiobacillus sp.]
MEQAIKEVAFVTTSLSFDRGMLSRLKDESKKRDLTVSQYVRSVLRREWEAENLRQAMANPG